MAQFLNKGDHIFILFHKEGMSVGYKGPYIYKSLKTAMKYVGKRAHEIVEYAPMEVFVRYGRKKIMEIKPCPFCRSNKVYISDSYYCVCCSECEAVGPRGETDKEGVELWNEAPRRALKGPESTPLNPEDSSGLKPFIPEAKDELKYIQRKESTHNQIQQLAEEAAELAQAALKFNRVMGCGCYTPVNPKDARDAVIEELADVLLCLEAAFPHCLGNTNFYSNLARIYREKAERWAERLKEAKDE